jgi:uncharacterized protein (DUF1684 family)
MAMVSPILAQTADPATEQHAYRERIDRWRKEQEANLKAEGGWLSVAGLYWLKEGQNTLGTGAANAIVLPAGSAPASVGVADLHEGKVTLQVASGVTATVNGKPITTLELRSDRSGAADRVVIGALTLTVIQRGTRIGIRLYDDNARGRREFTGLKWYPIDPAYRINARFVPYDPPKTVPITNVLGDTADSLSPGYLVFTLRGKELRLDAQSAGSGLFINFRDQTSGKTTYPAGRFLDAPQPENGQVILDFNQAYNPPCAFTAFATCPLPPHQNYLAVSIPAGEKTHHAEHP